RHLHRVAQPELLSELLAQLVVVEFLHSGHDPTSCASDVHRLAGRLEDAPLHAVLVHLEPDAVALLRLRVEDHHVRDGDRHLLVHDAALDRGNRVRVRPLVLLRDVDAFHDHPPAFLDHLEHGAPAAAVLAGDDDDLVAFPDLPHAHSTSGASEMIFMNGLVRSSRVTGPKMRVPMGSSRALSSTAALPSKRISEPSLRRTPFLVRATAAL